MQSAIRREYETEKKRTDVEANKKQPRKKVILEWSRCEFYDHVFVPQKKRSREKPRKSNKNREGCKKQIARLFLVLPHIKNEKKKNINNADALCSWKLNEHEGEKKQKLRGRRRISLKSNKTDKKNETSKNKNLSVSCIFLKVT